MNVQRFIDLLKNAETMADNLMKCPANEQNIGNMQAVTAQAIRDLAEAIKENSRAYTDNMQKKKI